MNELSRHIEILLLENDCVIIPGFGGFMAHHVSAVYVEEEGMFYPPQRTLGFNPHLQLNDSLLAQSYVEAYDISYPEAVRKIEAEVEEIRQRITIDGLYEFHGLGVIKLMANDKYEFIPCSAGLLTPELYALDSCSLGMIANKQVAIDMPLKPLGKEEKDVVPKEKTHDDLAEDESYDDRFVLISYTTLRNVMAAAMLLLLFVFSSIPVGQGSDDVDYRPEAQLLQCSIIDTEIISSFIAPTQGSVVADSIADSNEKEMKETVVEEVEKQEKHEEVSPCYAIVLASKVSKQGAENFVSRLTSMGLKSVSVFERGNMRKVVYGSYKSKEEANKELSKMRNAYESFSEAWVSEI